MKKANNPKIYNQTNIKWEPRQDKRMQALDGWGKFLALKDRPSVRELFEEFDKQCVKKEKYIVKCVIVGRNEKRLYNQLDNISGLEMDAGNVTDKEIWKDVSVGFIVANLTDDKTLNEFDQIRENATKTVDLVLPIIISDNKIEGKVLNVPPSSFESEEEMYVYIENAIKSIVEIVRAPGWIKVEIEDVKHVLETSSAWDFVYAEGTGDNAILEATKEAINKTKLEINSIKAAIYNINGRRENIELDKYLEATESLHDKCDCIDKIIWGTIEDDSFWDNIKVIIWLTS